MRLKYQSLFWSSEWQMFRYFAILIALVNLGAPNGGLVDIPISYLLKNQFQLSANEVANFRFWTATPFYFSIAFGLCRDRLNLRGINDSKIIILSAFITSILYASLALTSVTYPILFIGSLLISFSYLLLSSAWHGLLAEVGQKQFIAGQLSTAWNLVGMGVSIIAMFVGGMFTSEHNNMMAENAYRNLFLMGAFLMTTVAILATRPTMWLQVPTDSTADKRRTLLQDIRLLAGHRPIYPATFAWLLWNFAPGTQTVLQFFLEDKHTAAGMDWTTFNVIYALAFIPSLLLFGYLCRRIEFGRLLVIATLIGIPQMIPLMAADYIDSTLLLAIPIGLLGGMPEAAYLTLIIKSCPKGLNGTTMMLASSIALFSSRFGNVIGTTLYQHGGFIACVVASVLVYALILPTLFFVPKYISISRDGLGTTTH